MPRDQESSDHPEGSWACPGCNNVNWPKRSSCNKCQLARGTAQPRNQQQFNPQDHQPGSWPCPTCGNINWPARTSCNRKNCSTPKPANAGAQPNAMPYFDAYGNQAASLMGQGIGIPNMPNYFPTTNVGMYQNQNPYMDQQQASMSQSFSPNLGNNPPGSWECPLCNNVNWPRRTTCNKEGCGAPKPTGAATPGYSAPQESIAPPDPEGSWICTGCSNVNWPTRTVCNRRGCSLPRPEV